MRIRLISDPPMKGSLNMAVDEAIQMACAQGRSGATLRFYQWDPACLSLGFFQDAKKEVSPEGLRETGMDLVRRSTGGKAVLHDNELTYSVTIPEKDFPGSILETYRRISLALVEGLRTLGLPAEMVALEHGVTSRDARFRQAACFTAPSWYEVTVDDMKVIGSAQHRRDGIILQHGSIPFEFNAAKLVRCLRTSSDAAARRMTAMLRSKAAGICQLLQRDVSRKVVEEHLVEGFTNVLGWEMDPGRLTGEETQDVLRLNADKYGNDLFTLERGRRSAVNDADEIERK